MIDFLFSMTAVKAVFLPFAVSAGLLVFSPIRRRPVPSFIAIMAGFSMGFLLVRTFPVWPPVGGTGFVPYFMVAFAIVGSLADRPRFRLIACIAFIFGLPISGTLLIGAQEFGARLLGGRFLLYSLMILWTIMFAIRLVLMGPSAKAGRGLLYACLALSAVAFAYGSVMGLHALSLSAAILGALFGLLQLRRAWPRSASFASAGAYFSMALTLALSRELLVFPVAVTFLALLAPYFAQQVTAGKGALRFWIEGAFGIAVLGAALAGLLYSP